MDNLIFFPGKRLTVDELFAMDTDSMSREDMLSLIPQIETLYEEMEAEEPENPDSPEYYEWAEMMEAMDDMLDEIQDLLDE